MLQACEWILIGPPLDRHCYRYVSKDDLEMGSWTTVKEMITSKYEMYSLLLRTPVPIEPIEASHWKIQFSLIASDASGLMEETFFTFS